MQRKTNIKKTIGYCGKKFKYVMTLTDDEFSTYYSVENGYVVKHGLGIHHIYKYAGAK